jgi:hypothetical protein
MTRSIRRLVGGGIAALALGCFIALAVAPQVAATASSHKIQSKLAAGIDEHEGSLLSVKSSIKSVALKPKAAVTPSAACTSARQALDAARAKDKGEDTAERASATTDPNFMTTDPAEDRTEMAALKPLFTAVGSACGFTKPAPSTQCTAALSAMKAVVAKDQAEDAAERAAGTDDSAADMTEDQAERAALGTLWTSVRTACGFTTFGQWPQSQFGSTTGWRH